MPGHTSSTLAKHTEGIPAKLRRLVDRGILGETEPGLFTQPAAVVG
ncbi:hypothetical protein [Streptacidiphilus griseoplanus]|nr:hypothetical protein [Peterkaempfera griseoplana]